MKKFKKIFLTAIFSLVFVFAFSSNFKATPENIIKQIDGASIRMKTKNSLQGLKFVAKLDEAYVNNEHGFYLVYGKTSLEELKTAISSSGGNLFYLNDKPVYKVVVNGVSNNNDFSVILTGIPDKGYFDDLTAIAYVLVNSVEVFVSTIVTRSIAEVAFKMANEGEDINGIVAVDKIINSNLKQVFVKQSGEIEITEGVYELNYEVLKED